MLFGQADGADDSVKLSLVGKAKALLRAFQPAYWQALIVVSILYFARFDAGFVTLRAKSVSKPTHLSQTQCTHSSAITPCAWSNVSSGHEHLAELGLPCLQIMARAQLPLLTSIMMITQAVLSTPFGLRAKRSVRDRNNVLLAGCAVLVAGNALFAFVPSIWGEKTAAL